MSLPQCDFWAEYYSQPAVREHPWLDLSNESVQAQTFSLALEAAGPILGKSCVDIGCGAGRFSTLLAALGARDVTGIDQVLDPRLQDPRVRWVRAGLENENRFSSLPTFDRVFALEVLQYVPFAPAVRTLWDRVRPGGRLVAVVPNGACPIVRRAAQRFGKAAFAAPGPSELGTSLETLADVAALSVRGMTFQPDQRFVPYRVGPVEDSPPNRWLVALLKS